MTFDTSSRAVRQYRSISDENFRRSVDSVCKDFGLNILKNEQLSMYQRIYVRERYIC